MDIQKNEALVAEIEQFKEQALKMHIVKVLADTYQNSDLFDHHIDENGFVFWMKVQAWQLWFFWQAAKAQAVPEGFVLIEESKVKIWYQDDNEPENFCTSNNDFDVLGECLDHEDIIQVNKIQDAIIQTTPMYGVWKFKIIGGYPERDCFVLCGTEQEAESIRDEYRCMITPEAQEPAND